MRHLLILPLLLLLLACKTQRTVLAGPQKVSMGEYNDYNPNLSSDEMAAQMAATGQMQSHGGSGFSERFGFDSGGYGKEGLNAMSGKVFGGSTDSKQMKDFTQTRDFLTKRYGSTKDFFTKDSSLANSRSWLANRKVSGDRAAMESGSEYTGGNRILENKANQTAGRILSNRTSREDGKSAITRDFYPAKKVLDEGGDAPKMIGEGTEKQNNAVWNLIKGRSRDNPTTVQQIRDLLGKRD